MRPVEVISVEEKKGDNRILKVIGMIALCGFCLFLGFCLCLGYTCFW